MQTINRSIRWALVVLALTACDAQESDGDLNGGEASEQTPDKTISTSREDSAGEAPAEAESEEGDVDSNKSIFGYGTSCRPNSCRNGGTCVELWLGYRCECPPGYTGARCQTQTQPPPPTTCRTYTQPTAGMCAGLYCGLNESQLATRLVPSAVCDQSAAFTCSGTLPRVAGMCGREVKSANPLDPSELIRVKVNACIAQRPEVQGVAISDACSDCYTSQQLCIHDNCLIECLAGDSVDCDTCQRSRGCLTALYTCTGLPNPL
ncbi:MAG TPA: calcium-binding EGF-like domain-containing protein [Polyangiales bacterium]